MDLHRANCILTGASRGIGVYLAEHLARKGVNLALAARSNDELEDVARRMHSFGVRAVAIPTDVSRPEDLEALVEKAGAELGPIDLLVNNAGIEHYVDFHTADPQLIDKIIRVNVIGPEMLTRFVLPGMVERRHGHIVNIASVAGKTAVPYNAIYSSSKHALVGFSWSLREELRPHGIGVSVICPGFVAEAGMFADWSGGRKPPGLTRAVSPERVAEETIAAIEKDKAEVIVATGLTKIVDVFHAISPNLTTGIARKSGAYRFLANREGQHVSNVKRVAAALLIAVAVAACDDDGGPPRAGIPRSCGLPTVDPGVKADLVPEGFLLEDAEVTKVERTKERLTAAINNPHSVNESFTLYKEEVEDLGYDLVGQDNEGFEAELYLRKGKELGAVQIRSSRCEDATIVFVNLVQT